jgi:hypothetical protein
MRNDKMNKDKDKLSDKELKEKMDFDRFIRDYKPEKSYRSWKFYVGILVIVVFAIGVYWVTREDPEKTGPEKTNQGEACIQPPIQGIDIPFSMFEVDASRDTALRYSSGSLLHIPAGAFLDLNGKPIKGRVTISYREMHDAADFFVSGIPMNYDSAGQTYGFESAGMFQINAMLNSEQVYANPDVMIHVDLTSDVPGNRFNIYYLDTSARKWVYLREDVINPPTIKTANYTAFLQELKPPVKATSGVPRFDIAFDKKEFPELAAYVGVSFQVSEDEGAYDPKLAMKEWDNVKVQRLSDGIHYMITFSNPGEVHTFKVQPVYNGSDYTRARFLYEKKVKEYEQNLSKLKPVKSRKDSAGDQQKQTIEQGEAQAGKGKPGSDKWETPANMVFREFAVNRFGIWNSDCPQPQPIGKKILARFTDSNKKTQNFSRVYLTEKGNRTMYTYQASSFPAFAYNPASSNIVWAVTSDNKLTVFGPEGFEKLKNDKDSSVFIMGAGKSVHSVMEIKKLLGIRDYIDN